MLLRSSISNTKKLFQKTLQNLKSFFSPSYQKLPKTPPHNNVSYSVADMDSNPNYKDLEKFYSDFTEQWDSEKEKAKRRSKKKVVLSYPAKQEKEVCNESFITLKNAGPSSPAQKGQIEKREEHDNQNNKRSFTRQRERHQNLSFNSMVGSREHRNRMVEKKLRELEMLDMSNVDYVLDIEEVLHYYSRLTCPAYLQIVDIFFMEMYSEFFGPTRHASPRSVNSRLKLRSLRP